MRESTTNALHLAAAAAIQPAWKGANARPTKYDSWVTVASGDQELFRDHRATAVTDCPTAWLPPEYAAPGDPKEAKYMLEMWVSPQDLFRPCPDTEISDTACETSFPSDSFRMLDLNNKVRATEGTDYGVFKTYSSWFNNRTRNVYTPGSSPYPWTRLGYTYDWGSSNHVGLSEFVLHGRKVDGSTISVGIKSVRTTAEYFTR